MAKILVIDKKHFAPSTGMVPLRRGDDWLLSGQVIDRYAGYQKAVDLTDSGATGFFPAASGGTIPAEVTFTNAAAGAVVIALSKEDSANVALAEQGTSLYITLDTTDGLTTVETPEETIEVKDRGFEPS